MSLFNIYSIPPFITSILFLSLGLFIYFKNRQSSVNATFFLMCIATFIWQFSWFLLFSDNHDFLSKILIKTGWVGISFIPVTFYHFYISFLEVKNQGEKIILNLAYLVTFVFIGFLIFSNFFINNYYDYFWGYYPKAGFLHPWFLVFLILLTFRVFWLTYNETKNKKKGIRFHQLKFILWALILYILSAVDFIVNYGFEFYPFGFVFIIGFLGIFSYTIVTYRLLDIKFVLRKSSVYLLSFGVVFTLASILKIIANKYFAEFVFWMDLMIIFFIGAIFPSIKNRLFRLANKYFFTSLYDGQKLILKTSNELKTVLNIEKVYEFLNSTFSKNLHAKAFGVLAYNENIKKYELLYNKGFNAREGDIFDKNLVIEENFIDKNQIVITEEIKNIYVSEKTKNLIDILDSLGVALLIPLKVKNNVIGLLALGNKETEEAYNNEDLEVLEIIASQAAVAIENAQLYSEVKAFNVRLKRAVKKATKEVKQANDDLTSTNRKLSVAYGSLKRLDSAKNEFISIASHQLRTPLTSIKGYISLIRDGDYGKINKDVDEALKKIFISNERLIKLVNDLLSLSRIESGTFTFAFEKNNIVEMVKNIVDNFGLEAENQGLKIKYIKSDKKIPLFVFDRSKMHEVISNLIDNAVKYTQKGGIEVKIELAGNKIRVIVSDSGKGMEKDEAKYVFDKFRRGEGSSSLNTEGIGLGLYVCKKIVDAHDGRIFAKSEGVGKGSQFFVELKKEFKSPRKS